jgi:hypothetical protein
LERVIYQAGYLGTDIREIKILGESEHYYLIKPHHPDAKPRREKKILNGRRAHSDTWEGARQHMIDASKRKIEAAKHEIEKHQSLLGELESIKKPKGA